MDPIYWAHVDYVPEGLVIEGLRTIGDTVYIFATDGETRSTIAPNPGFGYYDGTVKLVLTVWAWIPRRSEWTRKASIPVGSLSKNADFGIATIGKKIYLVGGRGEDDGSGDYGAGIQKALYEYDTVTDSWTRKADMPIRLYMQAVGAVGSKIYAFGGSTTGGGYRSAACLVWDRDSNSWTDITLTANTPDIYRGSNSGHFSYDGKVCWFGGGGDTGMPRNNGFYFDPEVGVIQTDIGEVRSSPDSHMMVSIGPDGIAWQSGGVTGDGSDTSPHTFVRYKDFNTSPFSEDFKYDVTQLPYWVHYGFSTVCGGRVFQLGLVGNPYGTWPMGWGSSSWGATYGSMTDIEATRMRFRPSNVMHGYKNYWFRPVYGNDQGQITWADGVTNEYLPRSVAQHNHWAVHMDEPGALPNTGPQVGHVWVPQQGFAPTTETMPRFILAARFGPDAFVSEGGPVVRLYPRDDGRGLSAATRLVPPPKSTQRLIGGYQ